MTGLPPTREQRRAQMEAIALEKGVVLDGLDEPLKEQLLLVAGRELVRRAMAAAGIGPDGRLI